MQTHFSLAQLADADIRECDDILRRCVHCGFCLATCPTHVLLGDELDSPRGRIYLIKEMLESGAPPSPTVVKHLDRCLACFSCMTTCPSDVDYGHLLEHGRAYVAGVRSWPDRFSRWFFSRLLEQPAVFAVVMRLSAWLRPLSRGMPSRVRAAISLAPRRLPPRSSLDRRAVHPAVGTRRARVALLSGCVQRVLAPSINDATIRILTRHGVEVVVPRRAGCCGALAQHMGQAARARRAARANVSAWWQELEAKGLDGIIANASGCGMALKDYGHLLRGDSVWGDKAARIGAMAKDISEYLDEIGLKPSLSTDAVTVAYQPSCALRHGQSVERQPKTLLKAACFSVREVPEAHICCGSAGTYNFFEPEIAGRLRERKARHIAGVAADVVATSNIGCMVQLAGITERPVRHVVELLDWATGGPRPE